MIAWQTGNLTQCNTICRPKRHRSSTHLRTCDLFVATKILAAGAVLWFSGDPTPPLALNVADALQPALLVAMSREVRFLGCGVLSVIYVVPNPV